MTLTAPETDFTLNIYQQNNVVRTGCLVFYDGLMYSDLAPFTLTQLGVYSGSVPATDANANLFPDPINAHMFTLVITQ